MKHQHENEMEKARRSLRDNDFGTAIEHYLKALSYEVDDEDYIISMTELAIAYTNAQQHNAAIKALNSILHEASSGEQFFFIYSILAECYFNVGEYSSALKYYELASKYCRTQEDRGETKLGMGKSLFFLQRYKQARESLQECRQFLNAFTRQQSFVFHYYSGMTDLYLHKYESARSNLAELPKYQSNRIEEAMYYLALTAYYYTINDLEKMNEHLEIASKYESNQTSQKPWLEYHKERYLQYKKGVQPRV